MCLVETCQVNRSCPFNVPNIFPLISRYTHPQCLKVDHVGGKVVMNHRHLLLHQGLHGSLDIGQTLLKTNDCVVKTDVVVDQLLNHVPTGKSFLPILQSLNPPLQHLNDLLLIVDLTIQSLNGLVLHPDQTLELEHVVGDVAHILHPGIHVGKTTFELELHLLEPLVVFLKLGTDGLLVDCNG